MADTYIEYELFDTVVPTVEARADEVMRIGAYRERDLSRKLTAKDTTYLMQNIQAHKLGPMHYIVGVEGHYSHVNHKVDREPKPYVREYGSRYQNPDPFRHPAYEAEMPRTREHLENVL